MEMLTPEEVASILKVSNETVRRMLRQNQLPGLKVGKRQWRIRKVDLEAYITDGIQHAPQTKDPTTGAKDER